MTDLGDLPEWVIRRFTESGWSPYLAGLGLLVARPIIRAMLPPGYYFRFMDRFIQRRTNGKDEK